MILTLGGQEAACPPAAEINAGSGGILFALGMCMAMFPEWAAFIHGIVTGCIGPVILPVILMVRRNMEGKPVIVKLGGKTVGTVALGAGMCMVMVWSMMIPGTIVGLAGIVLLLFLIPLVKGIK